MKGINEEREGGVNDEKRRENEFEEKSYDD